MDLSFLYVIFAAAIVCIVDGSCAKMYRKITGESLVMSIIPFRETYLYIKLLQKIKKEKENGSCNDSTSSN